MKVYKLIKEDMTTLGHMGSSPTTVWTRLFSTSKKAQAVAEADYDGTFKWQGDSNVDLNSGDLSYVMYYIKTIEVE